MSDTPDYHAACECGDVELHVTGAPAMAGLCHCAGCRTWHAAPINAWAGWPNEAVTLAKGKDTLQAHHTETTDRAWCKRCGTAMMNSGPPGVTIVYAMALAESGYVHEPALHIHYGEAVLDLADGLPKFLDTPSDWGGSGETAPEPTRSGMRRPR